MRAMPLAFPDSRARARFRDAVHVRRRAARRADRARRRRSRHRAAARRVVRPQLAGALSPGRRCCAMRRGSTSFPVFGREGYALPLGRAVQHTGEINVDNPLELLWVFGKPAQPLDGYRQAAASTSTAAARATVRAALQRRRAGVRRRAVGRRAAAVTRRWPRIRPIAITVGRARGHRPRADRDARRSDMRSALPRAARRARRSRRCSPSARARIGATPRYARYDPLAFAPIGSAIEVWHQPLAAPAVPGHPDPTNARSVLSMLEAGCDACATGAFAALVTGPVQKSVIQDAGIPFSGHTEFFAERTHTPRVVMMLVGARRARRCASRSSRRTCRCATCPTRSRRRRSPRRSRSCGAS